MTARDRRWILRVCREAIAAMVFKRPIARPNPRFGPVACGGVFVTLRRGGRLRGCMGSLRPAAPVLLAVQSAALSASRDPRFSNEPLTRLDLEHLQIEVALLSPLRRTARPQNLVVGRHGIVVRHPEGQGCFLPQVATALRLSAEEFLGRCCAEKAGLSPDAWRDPRARVYLFTTDSCKGLFAEPPPAKKLDFSRDRAYPT